MTVKELVNLFDGVDFFLYDKHTQKRSKLNPIHELPDANVTSIGNAVFEDVLIIGCEVKKPVMIMCEYCWNEKLEEEVLNIDGVGDICCDCFFVNEEEKDL